MSLLAKFGGHRFYENGKINFDIIPYVNAWEKAELIASILRIETFSKSRISIYNPEVLDMDGRKKRRKTQAIPKLYECKRNKKKKTENCKVLCFSHKRNKIYQNLI